MAFLKSSNKNESNSKNVAKERLKLVLIHDRAHVSSRFLDMIKGDIIRVISDYVEIDEEGLDIKFTRTRRESDDTPVPALIANIPIIKMKDRMMD